MPPRTTRRRRLRENRRRRRQGRRRRRAGSLSAVKLAIVVQRYGADINGGAELHARYVAEHLSRHAEVEVLTTCARDYVTWRDEFPAGTEIINDVPVRRFRVDQTRDPHAFGRWSEHVFSHRHSYLDELKWLSAEGPKSTPLLTAPAIGRRRLRLHFFLQLPLLPFYHGVKAVPSRAILVPTAERDEAIGLAISPRIFRGVRALMYNSPEERRLIQSVSNNHDVPGVVVGIGSDIPSRPEARAVQAEVWDRGTLRALRRPHRSEQGVQGAVLVLLEGTAGAPQGTSAGPHRQSDAADPRSSTDSPSRVSRRPGQVRRAGRGRSAADAVLL